MNIFLAADIIAMCITFLLLASMDQPMAEWEKGDWGLTLLASVLFPVGIVYFISEGWFDSGFYKFITKPLFKKEEL